MNYKSIGPVRIKTSSKGLVFWGFPVIDICGLAIWGWCNDGSFMPISYHPRDSITWTWATYIGRRQTQTRRMMRHNFGGSFEQCLPFGFYARLSWQDRMRRETKKGDP